MATPPEFLPPPVTIDPATGARVMTGADTLIALTDALETGGSIRAQLIRLQAWLRTTQEIPTESPKTERTE